MENITALTGKLTDVLYAVRHIVSRQYPEKM